MNKLYFLVRIVVFPLSYLPYSFIRRLGNVLGIVSFYLVTNYRKRTLSNLSLASSLNLNEKELFKIAKASFQNLAISMLEYGRFAKEKDFSSIIRCENPEVANDLYAKGQGLIFFCGHQSNWETLFLDGNTRMRGVAIAKPIKNRKLYRWIVSIREKTGGKIISPKHAVRESLKSLKKGLFVGIVGDQSMPDSSYSFPFLGRRAWIGTTAAYLAYKSNSPIIVAVARRATKKYLIHYSDPIWPNLSNSIEQEIPRLMDLSLSILETNVRENPGECFWLHNRWKQQSPKNIYKKFRKDSLCLILPQENFQSISLHLTTFKMIYPNEFLFLFVPEIYKDQVSIEADEIIPYKNISEIYKKDYRFKLVFNFTNEKGVKSFYKKLSAYDVITLENLKKLAKNRVDSNANLSQLLKAALCRANHPF